MPLKILILIIVFVLPLVPTFWAIQEIPKRRFKSRRRKMLWFAVVATLPCLGALAYFAFERRRTVLAEAWGGPPEPKRDGEEWEEIIEMDDDDEDDEDESNDGEDSGNDDGDFGDDGFDDD